MSRTTEEQKKKIITDYAMTKNYSKTAKMNGVTHTTVRSIINESLKLSKNIKTFKKDVNKIVKEKDVNLLEYIDKNYEIEQELIDLSLQAMKMKLSNIDDKVSIRDITSVYNAIIDKSLKYEEFKAKNNSNNNIKDINDNILKISELLNNPQSDRKMEDV